MEKPKVFTNIPDGLLAPVAQGAYVTSASPEALVVSGVPVALAAPAAVAMSRREMLSKTLKTAGGAVLATMLGSALTPREAAAGKELNDSPDNYGGYEPMIRRFRLVFGRRQDYQEGFVGAAGQTDSIFELPEGVYGILPKHFNDPVAPPNTMYPAETAGYLHVTQTTTAGGYDRAKIKWLKAEAELNNKIQRIIYEHYPEYLREDSVFGAIRLPVVTLYNYSANRVEMFLRIPTPGTREFYLMTIGKWADYYDQSKLRNEHPFMTRYDPGRTMMENLETFYGPELQALRTLKQGAKNAAALAIAAMNKTVSFIFGKKRGLTARQKKDINEWLNVKGTAYAIK